MGNLSMNRQPDRKDVPFSHPQGLTISLFEVHAMLSSSAIDSCVWAFFF
jgi:hypothetical protein